jgi:biopolymer transport protein ExbD
MMEVRRRKQKVKKAKAEAEEIKFLNIVAMVDVLTILLIFLLKSVSVSTTTAPKTPNLVLPMSTTQVSPKDAVRVTIAKDKLFVQDEPVANINKGAIPDAELAADSPWIVPDLQAALLNMLRLNIVNAGGEKDRFMLEILADKETPYYLLQQVATRRANPSSTSAAGSSASTPTTSRCAAASEPRWGSAAPPYGAAPAACVPTASCWNPANRATCITQTTRPCAAEVSASTTSFAAGFS